tara:strand:+ start:95 stop:634 length:540 start_codon:yes stop_codon:yes gene_type:complete
MPTKKTAPFILTERIKIDDRNADYTGTIDLGAYVDVADRQGIAITAVDYIVQGTTASTEIQDVLTADATVFAQLSDLNRGGTLQFADDRALVSSMAMTVDQGNNQMHMATDIYPDVYGAADGVRLVVNDQLYLTARTSSGGGFASGEDLHVTVRIHAYVAKLTAKDYMAIAIQSTAADN